MQCTFKEATSEQFLASLGKATGSNPYFLSAQGLIKNKITSSANMFGIRHYAVSPLPPPNTLQGDEGEWLWLILCVFKSTGGCGVHRGRLPR
jgi:hypothetical protein